MQADNISVGIDEVGRGSWAGPLVAAAVILVKPIAGLKDSKLLSKSQRERLFNQINEQALAVGIGLADVQTINNYGLTVAVSTAMSSALNKISRSYDEVIIDGNYNFLPKIKNVRVIPKADNLVPCVSAASIVAKVYRDKWMSKVAQQYPNYGFEKHVGYGTKQHADNLKTYGVCPEHRLSYKPIQAILLAS